MSSAAHSLAPAPSPENLTRTILSNLCRDYAAAVAVRFWNGETLRMGAGTAGFTLVLKHPGSLRAMLWPKDRLGTGESYVFDDYDVEGDMLAFAAWLGHLFERMSRGGFENLKIAWDLAGLPDRKNSRDPRRIADPIAGSHKAEREREAVSYSYDLPGEFYRLFLDPYLQYTCGYFSSPDQDLDDAQRGKLDHVCRKLRLKPGERLLDIGCGWGGLLVHAAKHYGVRAVGVTLSTGQAEWARREIAAAGLSDRAEVVLSDYRDFRDPGGFDKAVSIGMGEAVRPENLIGYMAGVHDCLRPGGSFLFHVITLRANTAYPIWTDFSDKYVFPNGRLHTLADGIRSAGAAGFEVRDVENLREHYILTLQHWVRRLEAKRSEAIALTDDVAYRIFRLYMAAATIGFETGVYELMQTLYSKPDRGRTGLPFTRDDWYASAHS